MKVLWLAHAIPYPPKAGYLSRSYHLLRELTREHRVDLVAFVQEQWLTTLFANREEGLEQSRSALGEFCQNVTFLPIDGLGRFLGKQRTALRALIGSSTYTTSWLKSRSAKSLIHRLAETEGYDLVHIDTIGLAPYRGAVATPARHADSP